MSVPQPETKSDVEALTAAIERALDLESLRSQRLNEVSFGRYSNGSGWWWGLQFTIEVGNTTGMGAGLPEDRKRRVAQIVKSWEAARDRYRDDDGTTTREDANRHGY